MVRPRTSDRESIVSDVHLSENATDVRAVRRELGRRFHRGIAPIAVTRVNVTTDVFDRKSAQWSTRAERVRLVDTANLFEH